MSKSDPKLPRTSIELDEASPSEAQLLSEIHWLTFSMALKAFDQKASRAKRKEEAKARAPLAQLPRFEPLPLRRNVR